MTVSPGTGVDQAVIDMMGSVFAEYREHHARSDSVSCDRQLWSALDELGLIRLTGAEASGGSGAGWYESAELLSAAVRNGVRLPLAEHDLLACWLLEANGTPADTAIRTVSKVDANGRAAAVPWASTADRVVVVWRVGDGYRAADVDTDALRITPGANMIGEPRDNLEVDTETLVGEPVPVTVVAQLTLRSALIRAIQVCASLQEILELSVEHVTSRVQFGRPLSKFQAVQNQVADIAAEAALARAATEAALTAAVSSDWTAPNLEFLIAVARSCAGHAASVVVRNAHQVHGAIGTTREHRLHEFTRAALAWRSEFGSVRHWDAKVADSALAAGSAGLWNLITG
ncbi:acyl-CoA dehydrogenase family protein [Mycobacterium sp. 3519A]|uniref:acyl-CoA dehydrogenase family protein n=1 Tax=Mycobacterium sp. 3519A TaxID=2057184 RepID=UPI000C7DE8DD|nr:acyl-CoA dehydrogenase family protein [Mycobacterium sp. 3519A]